MSGGDDNREDGESPGSGCDETSCISDYLENSATATTTTATTAHTTHVSVSSCSTKNELYKLLREKDLALDRLEGKVVLLQKKLKDMAQKNKVLEEAAKKKTFFARSGGQSSTDSRNKVFRNEVKESIADVVRLYPRWNSKRTGSLIAQAVWSDQSNLSELLKLSFRYFRDKLFSPYNVLREMDLAGGTLSYEGIDVLRRVETAGLKRYRGSMIPSKSEIKRMASKVEWFTRPRCPFVLKETTKGESVEFEYAKAMLCITQAFHLDEVGKLRSLSIASSIDGVSLTKNLSIVAGGIKITDRRARCPLTKQALLDNPTTMKAQSRNLCIALKVMMGRETKETFVEFETSFSFLDDLGHLRLSHRSWKALCNSVA
jgi:hypothetical protein